MLPAAYNAYGDALSQIQKLPASHIMERKSNADTSILYTRNELFSAQFWETRYSS
jgi:hypothetical protein